MAFKVVVVAEAEEDLDKMRPFHRREILDAMELHLQATPTCESRAGIKRLRSVMSLAYRLRAAGDYRIFYDVDEKKHLVTVLRVLSKEQSLVYLRRMPL